MDRNCTTDDEQTAGGPFQAQDSHRLLMPPLLAMGFLLLTFSTGCTSKTPVTALSGKWVCRNLAVVEHVSQFKQLVIDFQPGSRMESYLVDADGKHVDRKVETYTLTNGQLQIGDGATRYRVMSGNGSLRLRILSSAATEDAGKTLAFRPMD